MFTNRVFTICLALSLAVHVGILVSNSNFSVFSSRKQKEQEVKVSYVRPLEQKESVKPLGIKRTPPLGELPPKVTFEKNPELHQAGRENLPKTDNDAFSLNEDIDKPDFPKSEVIAIKKKISLSFEGMDKTGSPSYIGYTQITHEKIKRAAYEICEEESPADRGDVCVSFVISKYGILEKVRVAEEKTFASPFLQQIALNAVKEAAPFPFFPKDLNYQRIPFSIIISFRDEQE